MHAVRSPARSWLEEIVGEASLGYCKQACLCDGAENAQFWRPCNEEFFKFDRQVLFCLPLATCRIVVVVAARPGAAPLLVPAVVGGEPVAIAAPAAAGGIDVRVRLSRQALLELRPVRKQGGPGATCRIVVVVAARPGAAPLLVLAVVGGEPVAIAAPAAAGGIDVRVRLPRATRRIV